MRDPVTDFEYPEAWVAACRSPDLLPDVERGLAVLTASGSVLRRGFTTGTTAAAACKAAVLSLALDTVNEVEVTLPCGITVSLPVDAYRGEASCRKDSGDYPSDVTAGLEFTATAVSSLSDGVQFVPGAGIGSFARNTHRHRLGTPAISDPALDCIKRSIGEAVEQAGLSGVTVILTVPRGAEVAQKTLNPRIGVQGGISILGTTGLVEPWDDHMTEGVLDRIARTNAVVLTTGRLGLRYSRLLFPDREAILVGSKLEEALRVADGDTVICGLPGLIMKFMNPNVLEGTGCATVEELSTTSLWDEVARRELAAFRDRYPRVRVVIVDRSGRIIGESP
ncbi:cobalt-precorrin-5B (C(1))-methyltransferase [Methanoculleus sp. DTU007]|jgi:cobalt-precorrin-5B (C1)-methyltransferase|uniref:cobalt-precorrin-5B (C(1))-methyltransferase n=1 Tax=Methanoculleus TaxID=45989 RepID=UPI000A81E9AD|nr:cobalt-precorrin-5B (C(1))-methyltransferase [Methanoculleus sp. DTU007]NLN08944.1 cobalt-precorrin-5B (C(1))-methyltransferase [Methanoculleus thermophilus]HQD26442.1 cobalt-precorrin-5B (C(1))-methyltransferase [Methanoculleus thermophilus]